MMKKTPWLCVISMLLCAGLLFGCGKNDEEDSSGISNRSKETDATSEVTTTASETSSEVTSESTTVETKVTTSEETLQETSQNTEVPTETPRSLSDEEAEMSRLRDEEEDDDGEEYEETDGNGNSNGNNNGGNGNGGNGGTTTTQPAETAAPIQTAPAGHWETRVIAEAWDETVVDQEAWDEEVKTAVGTKHIQNDTGTDMTGWSSSQKINWCESHNCPNHCDDYDPSQPGYCAANQSITTVYETQIIHHDAVTHVVHHDAVTEQVWMED